VALTSTFSDMGKELTSLGKEIQERQSFARIDIKRSNLQKLLKSLLRK
jgi:hypothetical protein